MFFNLMSKVALESFPKHLLKGIVVVRGFVGHPPASKCFFILMCFYSDVQKAKSSVGYRQFCLGRGFWVAGGPQMFYYSDVF